MSVLEDMFARELDTLAYTGGYEREYRFHPPRRWRFDFAWTLQQIAVEIEGGTWAKSRHTTGSGFEKDCEKYNQAALDGWLVLRFTSSHIDSGYAIYMTCLALGIEPPRSYKVMFGGSNDG